MAMMKIHILFKLILISIFLCCCAQTPQGVSYAAYPNCKVDDYCSVTGRFSIEEIDHVKMGKLILDDNKCINLSLPKKMLKNSSSGKDMTFHGQLYETPSSDELTAGIKIDGRKVGWSQCNKLYIFVN